MDDQPIFVAADVEDQAVVGNEIDARAELLFDVGRAGPLDRRNQGVPSPQRPFGLEMIAFPEKPQRSQRDDLHCIHMARSSCGNKNNGGKEAYSPR
jgi:hypothetical protein